MNRIFVIRVIGAIVLVLLPVNTTAQNRSARQRAKVVQNPVVRQYEQRMDSLIGTFRSWHYEGEDILANPYYSLLFGSPTLYSSTLRDVMGSLKSDAEGHSASSMLSSRKINDVVNESNYFLSVLYAHCPQLILQEEGRDGTLDLNHRIKESVNKEKTFSERFIDVPDAGTAIPGIIPVPDDMDVLVRKPNFWTFKGRFSLQFTQNYVSDNWYKGGESNNSLLAETILEANYNNRTKVTFDNKLEMKLGFQTSHNDDEHKFKTNSDLIRLTNNLGLRAVKHWYYTVMLQSWTQFYKGYRANDKRVYSDFMSPFESVLSLGMKYQMETKNKKFNVNATISPLALRLKYVDRKSLVTSFGLNEGHHAKWSYGSTVTVNYNWSIVRNVNWSGRIYYFTDYSKSQIEWENTFNCSINKYLSAKLFLYPRFDDSVNRKEGQSYFQFNELLSLGLSLNF